MTIMTQWTSPSRLLILAAAVLLSACTAPVESMHALSEPGQVAYDARILGDWASKKTSPRWFLSMKKGKAPQTIVALAASHDRSDSEKPLKWMKATAFASETNGKIYFNAQRHQGIGDEYGMPGVKPGYILLTIDLTSKGTLKGCLLNPKFIGGLISKQVILGEEIRAKYKDEKVPYYRINSDQKSLNNFIGQFSQSMLFDQCVVLHPSNEFPQLN